MTERQNAKLNMYRMLFKYCKDNSEAYRGIPIFQIFVMQLGECIVQIEIAEGQQASIVVTGITETKDNLENALVSDCITLSGVLYVYGFENRDPVIMRRATVDKNRLYKSHGNRVLSLAKELIDTAIELGEELVPFGITEAEIERIKEAIIAFEPIIVSPRSAINERKQYTNSLAEKLAAADSVIYDKLDKLIVRFKIVNPEFYNGYKSARNVASGLGGRKSAGKK